MRVVLLVENLAHDEMSRFFFFNDTATTEIYTLSLHDALPPSLVLTKRPPPRLTPPGPACGAAAAGASAGAWSPRSPARSPRSPPASTSSPCAKATAATACRRRG